MKISKSLYPRRTACQSFQRLNDLKHNCCKVLLAASTQMVLGKCTSGMNCTIEENRKHRDIRNMSLEYM